MPILFGTLLSTQGEHFHFEPSIVISLVFTGLFVCMGVRGKPRMYCSLLVYCTARFGRSYFWPPDAPAPADAFRTPAAEVGTYGRGTEPEILPKCRLPR
jgi:hypothetical protein